MGNIFFLEASTSIGGGERKKNFLKITFHTKSPPHAEIETEECITSYLLWKFKKQKNTFVIYYLILGIS